jgi:uncharacterized protein YkwD
MRAALPWLLVVLALSGCGGPGPAAAVKPDVYGCAGSRLKPVPANAARVRAATLCLLNAQRVHDGAPPLVEDARLQLAAERHSLDMAERKYFAHLSPEGVRHDLRIMHTGYPPIELGENLGWGEEEKSTPAEMLRIWMASPGHRDTLLKPSFRDIGIGLAYGAPQRQARPRQAAIYTTEFGAGGR